MEEYTGIPFEALFSHSEEAICIQRVYRDGSSQPPLFMLEAMNQAFEQLTGLRECDAKGRQLQDLVPDEFLEWLDCLLSVEKTGRTELKHLYRRHTGRWLTTRVFSPASQWLVLSVSDVTDVVAAQRPRNSESFLAEDFFEMPSAIHLISDPETQYFLHANKRAQEFYGWSLAELRTMRTTDIEVRSRDEQPPALFHRTKDGRWKSVEVLSGLGDFSGRSAVLSVVREASSQGFSEDGATPALPSLEVFSRGVLQELTTLHDQFSALFVAIESVLPEGDREDALIVQVNCEFGRIRSLVEAARVFGRNSHFPFSSAEIHQVLAEVLELKTWTLQRRNIEVLYTPRRCGLAPFDRVLMREAFVSLVELAIMALEDKAAAEIALEVTDQGSWQEIRMAFSPQEGARVREKAAQSFWGLHGNLAGWKDDFRLSLARTLLEMQGCELSLKTGAGPGFLVRLPLRGEGAQR